MQLTHLGHSCVLVEVFDRRILIDPGDFSYSWHDLTNLDAILVTHQHPDHADPVYLPKLIAANPQAKVIVEKSVTSCVELPANSNLVQAGESFNINGINIHTIGGKHAVIHPDYPRIGNVGYLLSAPAQPTLLHPGDCLSEMVDGVDVVLIPAFGPWAATKETIEFARASKANNGMLIHDGLLNERGYRLITKHITALSCVELHDGRDGFPWQC